MFFRRTESHRNAERAPKLMQIYICMYILCQNVNFTVLENKLSLFIFYQCIFFGGQHKEHWQAMVIV